MSHEKISVESALGRLSQGATLLAGGTDFYPALGADNAPDHCLTVGSIAGLDGIQLLDGYWQIGAAVTWSDIIAFNAPKEFMGLQQAAREVGGVQIQNCGTLVGNVCNASPAADGVPCLLALNAKLRIRSAQQSLTVELSEFISGVRKTTLDKHSLVTHLLVPSIANDDASSIQSVFIKLGSRSYLVISIVMLSVVIVCDKNGLVKDARIAVGACSAVAQRISTLEQRLIGTPLTNSTIKQCVVSEQFSQLTPIDDVRATASYRLHATKILIERALRTVARGINYGE